MSRGGEATAEKIRDIVLSNKSNNIDPWTETLLYLASRNEHFKKVVKPALDDGYIVLCDRFLMSTVAYQGYGRGLNIDHIIDMHLMFLGSKNWPNFTIYLDLPLSYQKKRFKNDPNKLLDRFDQANRDFKKKVLAGYREMNYFPNERFQTVDATLPLNEMVDEIEKLILIKLEGKENVFRN